MFVCLFVRSCCHMLTNTCSTPLSFTMREHELIVYYLFPRVDDDTWANEMKEQGWSTNGPIQLNSAKTGQVQLSSANYIRHRRFFSSKLTSLSRILVLKWNRFDNHFTILHVIIYTEERNKRLWNWGHKMINTQIRFLAIIYQNDL